MLRLAFTLLISMALGVPAQATNVEHVLGLIPYRYLFTGGYAMKLTVTEMRIDHMATRSRCPMKKRGCTIALSYTHPIGTDAFSSRFDFPLVSAEGVTHPWAPASVGDYVVFLSNTPIKSNSLRLVASLRF